MSFQSPTNWPVQCPWSEPGFPERLSETLPGTPWELSEPQEGGQVVTHRSSWVRRTVIGAQHCHLKTYDYAKGKDRRRGAFRNTFLAPSRALREARALDWLRHAGFAAPEPLLVWEWRRFGWLHRALLISGTWPGDDLDRLLPRLPAPERGDLMVCLREQVDRLLRAGFRHRNLDPRNILARQGEPGTPGAPDTPWQLAFLDAPRFRLKRPTPPDLPAPDDRLAQQDHARLAAGLARHGCDWQRR